MRSRFARRSTFLATLAVPVIAFTGTVPAQAVTEQFESKGDYVHESGGDASGHGWWVKISGNATKAKVTVTLQMLDYYGNWTDVPGSTGYKIVSPSTGSSTNRATGRKACATTAQQKWRSKIDVDLINIQDPPDKYYTVGHYLDCTP